jgi:hypothetical protein
LRRAFALTFSLLSMATVACGGDDTCLNCAAPDAAPSADAKSRDVEVAPDAADAAADSAQADATADGAASPGQNGLAIVSGAAVCASPKYKMVVSLGQGPATNGVSASPKFRMTGGVVGATQGK